MSREALYNPILSARTFRVLSTGREVVSPIEPIPGTGQRNPPRHRLF